MSIGFEGVARADNDAESADVTDGAGIVVGHGDPCPSAQDVVVVPGVDEALVYAFKDDNQGPPSADEVRMVLNCTRHLFADTKPPPALIGSTFDAFVAAVLQHPVAVANLPQLTAEIGDVWIYGAQADPWKSKMMRLLTRARTRCITSGACDRTDPAITNFTRLLLKTTEHTFGMHSLVDHVTWDNVALRKMLNSNTPAGQQMQLRVSSWTEQRAYIDYAMGML